MFACSIRAQCGTIRTTVIVISRRDSRVPSVILATRLRAGSFDYPALTAVRTVCYSLSTVAYKRVGVNQDLRGKGVPGFISCKMS